MKTQPSKPTAKLSFGLLHIGNTFQSYVLPQIMHISCTSSGFSFHGSKALGDLGHLIFEAS